ncbi:hypothetical protein J8C02_13650 [Chloracidobacterium sp. MS 40/45]|uniref:hypothetical protein n=1 Tax=Chloracidobacterium aggregatum TaxID=2851959 RepID=UPI001B8D04F8|nr:hypothetical protein [Chloracidobacterium aggregatum]QUW01186.1 hypothetical protein J8C02_13650 [Chloracidobacterium sp. MS 40/45]
MMDSRQVLVDWLRAEFATEQASGFARLKRIPDTRLVRFLDTFTQLNRTEQSEVVNALTEWASYRFFVDQLPPPAVVEQFSRWTHIGSWPTVRTPLAEGVRYTNVNLLAGLAKTQQYGSLEGWLTAQGITGLAAQPSEYLASRLEDLKPIKIPTLRRLVQRAFATRFAAGSQDLGSEFWLYQGRLGETALGVEIRYSGRMTRPQLQYSVRVAHPTAGYRLPGITFEGLLGVGGGWWDYLTVGNAERSVALLCDLVEYAARLPERLPRQGSAGPDATAAGGNG